MNTHTPGPWVAYGCAVYQADDWQDGVNTAGHLISELPEGNDPDDEASANARLIAAAPDLLAALQEAVQVESTWKEMTGHDLPPWYDNARQALNKAKSL